MKKTLIALAAVAVTGAASAQVTLYGLIDMNYGSLNVKDATGAKADSITQFGASSSTKTATGMGSGGLSGSRWGLKGSEDLGGGLSANFVLESSISANTGASTGFTRGSWVGLAGDFGAVTLGRQYTPSFSAVGGTDIDGTSAYSTSNQYTAGVRASNAVMYTAPAMGGVTLKAMVASEKAGATGATKSTLTDISATYAAGPLMLVASANSAKGKNPAVAFAAAAGKKAAVLQVDAADTKTTGNVIGATYDLGVAKVMFNAITTKHTNNLTAASSFKASEQNIGVSMPVGAITLIAGYGKNKLTVKDTASVSTSDNVVGANYAMSKRTDAYIRFSKTGVIDSDGAKGAKVNKSAIGLRHKF